MKRLLIFVIIIVLLGGAGLTYMLWWRHRSMQHATTTFPKSRISKKSIKRGSIRLIATGDFIFHDAINLNAKQPDGSYQYLPMMTAMKPFFGKADIRFCNQATPAGGSQFGVSGYPIFNAPLSAIDDMAALGCNVINTGTNHTFDKGQAAIDAELNEWDKQTNILAVAGANRSAQEQAKIRYFTISGVRFAFLAYATYSNADSRPTNSYGLNVYSDALVQQQITTARQSADVIIVSIRWGTEYASIINSEQERIAQRLATAGADIVLGHGPHVLQPVKQLSGPNNHETLVWYSLGNFLNSQLGVDSLVCGLAVMNINTSTKKITDVSFLPTYMHYEWTADQKKRQDLLARRNFQLVPLDQAAGLLARSQNNTTVAVQQARVGQLLNTYTAVSLITSKDY